MAKTLSSLERKIDKHMRDNANQIQLFKYELQNLRTKPAPMKGGIVQMRPPLEPKIPAKVPPSKVHEPAIKHPIMKSNKKPFVDVDKSAAAVTAVDQKRAVKFAASAKCSHQLKNLLLFLPQQPPNINQQHHPNDFEHYRVGTSAIAGSCYSESDSRVSEADTLMTTKCDGRTTTTTAANCSAQKLLQFLLMELRAKVKHAMGGGSK